MHFPSDNPCMVKINCATLVSYKQAALVYKQQQNLEEGRKDSIRVIIKISILRKAQDRILTFLINDEESILFLLKFMTEPLQLNSFSQFSLFCKKNSNLKHFSFGTVQESCVSLRQPKIRRHLLAPLKHNFTKRRTFS